MNQNFFSRIDSSFQTGSSFKKNGAEGEVPQTPGLNPFLPFGTYIPDGEPKVFGDRVYLYGSFDSFNGSYCSKEYHVVSAPVSDLTKWTDHGVSFTSDEVPWSDALLYAPDALYHNGAYYLFFCMSDGSEGVAKSASPEGPFKNPRRITLNGEPIRGIDPSVLEENGHIYYTWGQFELNMGELNDDLCTLKPGSVQRGMLSNADGREGFHEGSSLRKIGGKYCIIYASEYTDAFPNHGARPTKLDYAVASSPYGPYERRGTVIDNEGCDPESWNNHGSVLNVNGAWYVFYHASSNHSSASRRARVERLEVDAAACRIQQASPTTNGFLSTLLPEHITSPVNACRFFGGAYVTETKDGRFPAVGLKNGAGFAFSPLRFKKGGYTLKLRFQTNESAHLQVRLGDTLMIDETLPKTLGLQSAAFLLPAEEGFAPLRFIIHGKDGINLCEIDAVEILPDGQGF